MLGLVKVFFCSVAAVLQDLDFSFYLKLVTDFEVWEKPVPVPSSHFPRGYILALYSFLEHSCKHLVRCRKHYETAAQSPVAERHGDTEMNRIIKTIFRLQSRLYAIYLGKTTTTTKPPGSSVNGNLKCSVRFRSIFRKINSQFRSLRHNHGSRTSMAQNIKNCGFITLKEVSSKHAFSF